MLIVLPKLGHRTCWLALLCFGAVPLTPSDRDPGSDTQVAVETTPGDQPVAGGRNPAVGSGTSEADPGSGLNLADSTRAASRPADPDSPVTAGSSSAPLTGSFLAMAPFTLLPGDIFLTQDNGSTPGIARVDPTTGIAVTVVSDPALSGISGIAIDASGRVLVTILNPPELRRVDPTTGNVSSLKLFDENFFFNASDVAVEDDGNILVVTEGVDGPPPTVIRYDPVGDIQTDATDGLAELFGELIGGIAIEADGNIIFSLPFLQEIRRINRITKIDTVLASGVNLSNPAGVAIAPNGDIIVADPGAGTEEVISIDPVSGAQTVISADGLLTDPFDVATEGDGAILVADGRFLAPSPIVRLAAGTFTQSVLTTMIDNMRRLEVVPCLPSVTNVTPATIPAGDAATPITVDGSCFNTTSVISFDGTTLATMFVSATSLQATVPAVAISAAGSFNVLVTNTYPAAGASGPFPVSVADPSIASLTPPSVCAGDPAFVNLGVNGANFAAGATANWDAAQMGTTFVNSTLLNADPQSLHNTVGMPTITVVNNPGGVTSPGFSFSVVGPSNSGLNPLSTIVGGPSFPLIVMGGCFVTGSTVLFNGTPVATVVNSGAQVTGTIPAALIASTGTVPVQVMNPGGALSASGNFDINNPAPTLTSLGQNIAAAGDPGFTLTLTGGGFVAGSTVQFDGVPQATAFVNGTTLTAAVPAAQLAAAGTFNVTVFNAAPGGGTSAPLQFTVNNPASTLTSLGQNSATAGAPGFTLTLTGGGFVAGSTVQFDGVPQATAFVNGTTLTAAVPAAQLAAAGTFNVTVFNAAPGGGTSAPLQFTVNNQSPIADAGADQNVSTGDSARVQVTLDGSGSSDPDGDPLTFTWTGSFGTRSGMIVDPALDPGTHAVTLTVADGKGGVDTDTVQISVSDGRPPKIRVSPSSLTFTLEETSAPPAASASLVPARPVDAETASKPFRLTVERGPVNFRIRRGSSWVRADPDVGQLIDGVGQRILAVVDPAGLPAGTYTAPLFISAGAGIAARLNVTLVITPASAPRELTVTSESPLPNGTVGSPYNGMLSATGGSPPLSWSTAGGALPPGLVLNAATGAIGGTPTAPGVVSWVTIVTDAEGLSAAKAFSIQIAADPSQEPRLGVRLGRSSFSFVPLSAAETQMGSIFNNGGAPISFQIDSMRLSGSPWLSVSLLSAELPPGAQIPLTVRADPGGFAPGTYLADIVFSSHAGADFSVSVSMVITRRQQLLRVSQRGLTFTAVSGGGQVPSQSFQVLNDGWGVMPWNIGVTTLAGGNWPAVTPPTGVSESSRPATVDMQVNTQGLTPRAYYGLLEVATPDAANSPQFVTLVLNLLPSDRDPGPIVMPLGLIFATPPGGPAPPSQSVRISNLTPQPLPFTVQALTLSGGAWLGPVSAEGTVVPGESAAISVEVVPGELAPGIYRGLLRLLFDGELSRTVDVVLVVVPASTAGAKPTPVFQDGCNRTELAPVFRLLGGTSPIPAGWPTSIEVDVADDCGAKLEQGSVIADFSNVSSPSLALGHSGSGLWTATWNVPAVGPDSMAIVTVTATDPAGIRGVLSQALAVSPNPSPPPQVAPGGVVHSASFVLDPLAPGTIVSIFGSNLSSEPVSGGGRSASSIPLTTELAGTQLILGGRPLPILFSREDQVNAVVPFEVADRLNESLPLLARRTDAGSLSVSEPVLVTVARPGVFTQNASGSGPGSVQNVNFQIVTPARPVKAGDAIIIYGTGMGAVFPEVASGDPAPASPLARTAEDVTVTIGGRSANVLFAGLTPGFTSLYQVNAVVPTGVPAGETELVVSIAGQASPVVTLAVE